MDPADLSHPNKARTFSGSYEETLQWLPTSRKLQALSSDTEGICALDSDYMVASGFSGHFLRPVALVSKDYEHISHREFLQTFVGELGKYGIRPGDVSIAAICDPWGARMMAQIRVDLEEFSFSPDGHQVNLSLYCFNSVDASTRLRVLLGWLRMVCSNGMIVGEFAGSISGRHDDRLDLDREIKSFHQQFEKRLQQQEKLTRLAGKRIEEPALRDWVDNRVQKTWGPNNAARLWHILRTGHDALCPPGKAEAAPSLRKLEMRDPVPGAPEQSQTAYDVYQAMTWMAGRLKNPESRTRRTVGAWDLVQKLMRN